MSEHEVNIKEFSRAVNSSMHNPKELGKELADQFIREHRTLQNSMASTLYEAVQEVARRYSECPERYADLRNQDAMDWILEISKVERYFRYV
jgi:hypothetical protein